ncbi:M13 family metallopeptidase [Sphingomonas sp.]|uniref:M13 family metallopeptidase n=1 Tax=Sphingomonas sp. TaxID=28214 RepID=UPI0025E84744|nr:M13 family metallopeptidase [Sphingomonas sp.]
MARRVGLIVAAAGLIMASLAAPAFPAPSRSAEAAGRPKSGIDPAALDPAVRPQDDFYGYAVGGWIAHVDAPAYFAGWSASRDLQLRVYEGLDKDIRAIAGTASVSGDQRKLADLYRTYMDVARIDAAGLRPIAPALRAIDAVATPDDIVRAIARLGAQGIDIGVGIWVHPDDRDPSRYIADIVQSDLGLPDRDYYLGQEARIATVRAAYRHHVARLLELSGVAQSDRLAGAILDLETRLAGAQWSDTATRVPGATAHRMTRRELRSATSPFDLSLYADGMGVPRAQDRFNLAEPDYAAAFGKALAEMPAPVWRAYLRYRLLDHLARFLPRGFRDEADQFWTFEVAGATAARPRWLRAMTMIEDAMGDAMGRLYVSRHFPASARSGATAILDNVVTAFRKRIAASTWMHEASRKAALDKLDRLVIRMGAPDHGRDYGALAIDPRDPVGNWLRARTLLQAGEIAKLSRPVDREEWTMSPQSVNGYYSVSRNQVVLPAALLQPPYFDPAADPAANCGALGFFIAHELSHAFDRAGSQYDGSGKRVDWMTPEDRNEFERRADALVHQYGGYDVAPGHPLDGKRTIGENIADTAGLAIALDAYRLALGGAQPPALDGFSGLQRFYLGFARIWASEPVRTPAEINAALTDTHAPDRLRVTGALTNQDAFYGAFGIRPGDKMYRAPADRVTIW